jgi:BMFP domain-containing protein YqiC
MALKPPPIGDLLSQFKGLAEDSGLKQELDKNSKALMQTMLAKLDVVTREEFDAQCALLTRAQQRIAELEAQIKLLEENG